MSRIALTLDERVIQHEENRCHIVRDLRSSKKFLADITYIAQLRMFKAVPPEDEGSVQNDRSSG